MQRHFFQHDGLRLSFLDDRGKGAPLIALHSHWMEGVTYTALAAALAPDWRVIALDQRGHGHSDHAGTYARTDYLGDLEALFMHLGVERAVILGNSLGGVNAYQFAARRPARVTALIVEDIGAVLFDDPAISLAWRGTFATRAELESCIGPRMTSYLHDSFRETPNGWTLAFDPNEMMASQQSLNGDHWADWLASDCPALLVHGRQSPVTKLPLLQAMAARRRHTDLRVIDGGHVVHVDNPAGFEAIVREFLRTAPWRSSTCKRN